MTIKSILFTATLALATLTVASAKSYEINLSSAVHVGGVELKPGQYSLKIQGNNAIFTEVETAKSFTAPVKVDNGTKRFGVTMVDTSKSSNGPAIKTIELGGSKTTLDFGE